MSVLPVFIALILNLVIGPLAPANPLTGQSPDTTALAAPGDVVITQAADATGCMGVVTTPGSENTNKRLISGNLEPGGTATFEITFPVDPDDVGGDFRITDCVFIDADGDGDTEEGEAGAKYFIDFVPNFEDFILTFTLNIPDDAPIGDEYCNFAKTTESPSQSQASNRKAGPACFVIGGALRVSKVDQAGAALPGATFSISCTFPTTTSALAATIIGAPDDGSATDGNDANGTNDVTESYASTSGGVLNVTAVTGSDGIISVNAPVGTNCVFTETAAPSGYLPPTPPNHTVTLVVPGSGESAETHTFTNTRVMPDVIVAKSASQTTVLAPFSGMVYTITASNTGTAAANGVVISDYLDDDLVVTSATFDNDPGTAGGTGDCSVGAGNAISCGVGTLAASDRNTTGAEPDTATATITVDVPVAACPSVTNTSSVSATNEEAGQQGNNSSNTVDVTVNCPDVSVLKTSTDPVINSTESASFNITVDAGTLGTTSDVVLNDSLPAGFTWTVGGADIGDCWIGLDITPLVAGDEVAGGSMLNCNFGPLGADETRTITLSGQTAETDCDLTITNTATVSADGDTATSNNTSTATVEVQCPGINVDKLADDGLVSAGETIGFSIEVENSNQEGTGTAFDVTLDDELPGGPGIDWSIDYVVLNGEEAADASDFCAITGEPETQSLVCDFGDMDAGDLAVVHVSSATTADSCAPYDNTAVADAFNHGEVTSPEATVTVECPGLNLVKTADVDPIDAADEASFTITLWNAGPGEAFDVELHDDLPAGLSWDFEVVSGDATDKDCSIASSIVLGGEQNMSIDCEFGTVGVTTMEAGIVIRVFADTNRTDCGLLENTATADGSNLDAPLTASDSILVKCPTIELEKANDAVGSVVPGTTVTYTLTLTVDDGPADHVMVVDSLPVGLENPTSISNGGEPSAEGTTITWDLGELADGEYTLTYLATVADDVENGDELVNAAAASSTNSQCPDLQAVGPECEDDSTVIVRTPTLTIDKEADAELITITGEAGDLTASPSIVTWTLTYTLTNGPVTNAVITDEIPAGFVFLDASDGGQIVDGTVTWTRATLSESGGVTFRTTVDPETISRIAPTVNVAVIDSDETEPDEGQDSVTVVVEPPVLGGNPTPTPKPELPDTAAGIGLNGDTVSVPLELLVALFGASLSAMTLANVKARSRRR